MEGNKEVVAAQPTAVQQWSQEEVDLIKNTVARGASDNELKLFLMVAKRSGLDPFSKQIHFVKRKTKFGEVGTIQTGIDGFRAIAERSGSLAGIDDPVFDSEDMAHPQKATVTVYRWSHGARISFTASARWAEYAQPGQYGKQSMWDKMPYLMLGKCAEALALRKASPNDLSGIYSNGEMQQADRQTLSGEGYDTTPIADDVEVISTGDDTGEEPPKSSEPTPAKEPTVGQKKKLVQQLLDKQSLVELKTKQDYADACQVMTGLELTEANYDAIITKLNNLQHGKLDEE